MAILTTGIIKNTIEFGQRQTATLVVRYRNSGQLPAVIQIRGYYLKGNDRIEYVVDSMTLAPGMVKDSQHYAQFDALEFRFITTTEDLKLKAWGKNSSGTMTVTYPLHLVEDSFPGQLEEATKKYFENRLYVVNSEQNSVDVLDKQTQALITRILVGTNPQGVDLNLYTGRVYVSNSGSNTVTVIDGVTNTIIATVLVGAAPREVRVDPKANRIYVTNQGSKTISVINGTTHTVMATSQI